MRFGAHVSSAGGLANAPKNAAAIGCEVFQFFSRPPQSGRAPALTPETIERFRATCAAHRFDTYVIHSPYIINFASASPMIRGSSVRIIREELDRGSALGARAVMFHPGSAKDVEIEEGIRMVAQGIRKVLDGYAGSTQLLIEISAGAGNVIGDTFEEVAAILDACEGADVGVCFDTAHAFASGYDLRTPAAVKETFDRFEATIGLDRLVMSHCNDSKVALGTHKDRHEHIGRGHLGVGAFEALLKEKRLKDIFWIVETPPEGAADDLRKLEDLRGRAGAALG